MEQQPIEFFTNSVLSQFTQDTKMKPYLSEKKNKCIK